MSLSVNVLARTSYSVVENTFDHTITELDAEYNGVLKYGRYSINPGRFDSTELTVYAYEDLNRTKLLSEKNYQTFEFYKENDQKRLFFMKQAYYSVIFHSGEFEMGKLLINVYYDEDIGGEYSLALTNDPGQKEPPDIEEPGKDADKDYTGNLNDINSSIEKGNNILEQIKNNTNSNGQTLDKINEAIKDGLKSVKDAINKNGDKLDQIKDAINNAKDQITDAINKNGDKVTDAVNKNGDKITDAVNKNTDAVKDLHDEFKTDKDYKPKPLPDTSDLIDKNKPDQPDKHFEDNNDYFKDNGDSPDDIGKLPGVPEPTDNWDGTKKEDPLDKEKEFNKDDELQKDKFDQDEEMQKDQFEKDKEMEKDQFHQDKEMEKDKFEQDEQLQKDKFDQDEEMKRDQFHQDKEMEKDRFEMDKPFDIDRFDQTENYDQNNNFQRQDFYDQTYKFYEK